jgi:uncharacterized protein (DUF1697 family)
VILKSGTGADEIRARIEDALPESFNLDDELIWVLLLTRDQLQAVIDNKPEGFGEQPEKYHSDAIFLMGIDSAQVMETFNISTRRDCTRTPHIRRLSSSAVIWTQQAGAKC